MEHRVYCSLLYLYRILVLISYFLLLSTSSAYTAQTIHVIIPLQVITCYRYDPVRKYRAYSRWLHEQQSVHRRTVTASSPDSLFWRHLQQCSYSMYHMSAMMTQKRVRQCHNVLLVQTGIIAVKNTSTRRAPSPSRIRSASGVHIRIRIISEI